MQKSENTFYKTEERQIFLLFSPPPKIILRSSDRQRKRNGKAVSKPILFFFKNIKGMAGHTKHIPPLTNFEMEI